ADDALRTTSFFRKFVDARAFAVPALGGKKHVTVVGLVVDHDQRYHIGISGQLHAAHAGSHAAHRTHRILVKTVDLAVGGKQKHIRIAVGQANIDQCITLFQADGDLAALQLVGVFAQRRFLDLAVASGKQQKLTVGVFTDWQNRLHVFVFL